MKYYTSDEIREMLRQAAEKAGSQAELARLCGVGRAHIHDILSGDSKRRKLPGPKVCKYLGVQRQTVFCRAVLS